MTIWCVSHGCPGTPPPEGDSDACHAYRCLRGSSGDLGLVEHSDGGRQTTRGYHGQSACLDDNDDQSVHAAVRRLLIGARPPRKRPGTCPAFVFCTVPSKPALYGGERVSARKCEAANKSHCQVELGCPQAIVRHVRGVANFRCWSRWQILVGLDGEEPCVSVSQISSQLS